MGMMREIMKHPDELYPLMKLMLSAKRLEKQTPLQQHWAFCYITFRKLSHSFALVIQQLPSDLRDVVCVYYLVLRALDTVEDDTSLATEIRVPILRNFYCHFYDPEWHLSCRKIDNYNEYFHYAAGLCGLGLSKLFLASGREDLAPESLSIPMGLFLQKINIIRDYLEGINEVPKCRMYWPVKFGVNMLTNLRFAFIITGDCLTYMSNLRDPAIFQFCAISQIINMGNLMMCYNNAQVFKGDVEMRRGLCAKIIDKTRTMPDVYGAFFDFCCIMEFKVDRNDPKAISKTCRDFGTLISQMFAMFPCNSFLEIFDSIS